MFRSMSRAAAVAVVVLMIFFALSGLSAGKFQNEVKVANAASSNNLIIGYTDEPTNPMNAILLHNPEAWLMLSIDDDSLLQWDQNLVLRPDLATSWNESANGLTYTFNLRHDVNWSDGVPLTAQDVEYTIAAIINYSTDHSSFFNGMTIPDSKNPTGVTINSSVVSIPNNYTITFNLPAPYAPLFLNIAGCAIIPEHIFAGQNFSDTTFVNSQFIGSGPFIFSQYVPGDHLTLTANPHYWGGEPKLSSVTFKVYQTQAAAEIALKDGEVNFVQGVLPQDVPNLNSTPGLTVTAEPSWNIEFMGYNFNAHLANGQFNPISIKDVREAISQVVNISQVVSAAYNGYATPIDQVWIPFFGINGESFTNTSIPFPQVNLTNANLLLNQSGYPWTPSGGNVSNGSPYRFVINTIIESGDQQELTELTAIQTMLSAVGINLIVTLEDSNTFFQDVYLTPQPVTWNLYGVSHISESPDPDFMATFMLTPPGPGDSTGYNNTQEQALAAAADNTGNDTLRVQLYRDIAGITASDYAWLWLDNPLELNAYTTNFHGFVLGPQGIYSGDEGILAPWSLENVTVSSPGQTTSTTSSPPLTSSSSAGSTSSGATSTTSQASTTTTTTTTSTSSSSNTGLYEAIAAVVVIIIIVAAVALFMRRRGAAEEPS
jgi:peptide/nickel transport system substrate-binding protein